MKNLLPAKNLFKHRLFKLFFATAIFLLSSFSFHASNAQSGETLNFDGIDDYVDLPFIVQNSYTKEAWINIPAVDGAFHNILSGSQTALYVVNGQLTAGHNPTYNNVQDPTPLAINTWYHIAVTFDNTTGVIILYKNGVAVASGTAPAYMETEGFIGALYTGSASNFFAGSIDEVRFWSVVRTPAEIAADANCSLMGNEPNLIAYYNFNQGTAGGTNTGITTLTDNSVNGQDGILFNFALTGATSNWIAPGAPLTGPCVILPIDLSYFSVQKAGNKVKLEWKTASEHNNNGFEVERSINGTTGWQKIAFIKGAGNSSREISYTYNDFSVITGDNFYRLKQTDYDGTIKYSFIRNVKFDGIVKPITIYPSVTRGKITIDLGDNSLLNSQLYIIDNQGRVIKKELVTQIKQDIFVNTLPNGMYFIKTEKGDTEKFIKQ
ncbi:MAG: T9SS type A sorting domain-containing protein [Bacteroidota bacterium]|nr:T9SS type A sorting domain-containing protein [Bacteroidota bacterium]